jgi:heat shock protein HtpX
MDLAFCCPRCQQHLVVDSAAAGIEVSCPGCSALIAVPQPGEPPLPNPDAPPAQLALTAIQPEPTTSATPAKAANPGPALPDSPVPELSPPASEPTVEAGGLLAAATGFVTSGQWIEAVASFAALRASEPQDPRHAYNLGVAWARLGRIAAARLEWEAALRLNPDYLWAQRALALLEPQPSQPADHPRDAAPLAPPPPAPEVAAREAVKFVAPPGTAAPPIFAAAAPPEAEPTTRVLAPANLWGELPVAEMYAKAGLTIWAVVGVLMLLVLQVRLAAGVPMALIATIVVFGAYAAAVAFSLASNHGWIAEQTTDPEEQRLLGLLGGAAKAARLPRPDIALARDHPELNVWTYGLSPTGARVVVTQAFLEHVQPTDPELQAVLAHELSHVHHRDFVIATLMRFPIWVLDRLRGLLAWVRAAGIGFLQGVLDSGVGCGIVGLVLVVGILGLLVYLSMATALVWLAMMACLVFLFAFEREREYLADLYASRLLGSTEPMQRVLAKLEQAAKRVQQELEQRAGQAKEGEAVELRVAPPPQPMDPVPFIAESLNARPGGWEAGLQGEFFSDHPDTRKRIYYLQHPAERKQALSVLLERLETHLGRRLPATEPAADDTGRPAALIGVAAGFLLGLLPAFRHWSFKWLALAALVGGGFALGQLARTQRWTARLLVRRTLLAAYLTATALLVVGPLALNPWTMSFPLFMALAVLVYGAFAIRGASGTPTPADL